MVEGINSETVPELGTQRPKHGGLVHRGASSVFFRLTFPHFLVQLVQSRLDELPAVGRRLPAPLNFRHVAVFWVKKRRNKRSAPGVLVKRSRPCPVKTTSLGEGSFVAFNLRHQNFTHPVSGSVRVGRGHIAQGVRLSRFIGKYTT